MPGLRIFQPMPGLRIFQPIPRLRIFQEDSASSATSTSDDEVAELWQDDVHARAGIGCETCHGGDPVQDDSDLAKRSRLRLPGRASFCE